ncbi:protein adenylyltransferase SelO [Bacillus infantis]|uniref:Protein nucleotidyltransferase YdiU n=1 Tax=Bacillus infantis TaxID=324767 RepID=A0A5D4RAL2_9BACI|nr:YdiU family protein [Bacillus infantis]TYS48513.1 YdiU family protein [Bacillus infantis]
MTNSNRTGWKLDNSYARLPKMFFTSQDPNPVEAPELAILNGPLAASLGLDDEELQSAESISILAGNEMPEGAAPLAQAYAGHQFGHFNMLGDGRALLIGEQITPEGDRFDIQLKGSGRTPYSRGGDGRAALGPMLREYIISEAMHSLGIPTTRSLAVVTTGEMIRRETMLPGAILTRIADSHLRVGTFQFAAQFGEKEDVKALADYAISRHYPEIEGEEQPYLELLKAVIRRQASLIAQWQLAGFIHGVMNTDNMTISGETIDYGPCAFMDTYNPETVFSSIDVQGRYAYGNQPYMAGWNLARLAESLLVLLHDDQDQAVEIAQKEISGFMDIYQGNWLEGMGAKLGIFSVEKEDGALVDELLSLMKDHQADFTNTFRALTIGRETALEGKPGFAGWHDKWKSRLAKQDRAPEDIKTLMQNSNPAVIPRNHRVEEALEAAVEGDYSLMGRLLNVLAKPYAHAEAAEEYCTGPDDDGKGYVTYCGT